MSKIFYMGKRKVYNSGNNCKYVNVPKGILDELGLTDESEAEVYFNKESKEMMVKFI